MTKRQKWAVLAICQVLIMLVAGIFTDRGLIADNTPPNSSESTSSSSESTSSSSESTSTSSESTSTSSESTSTSSESTSTSSESTPSSSESTPSSSGSSLNSLLGIANLPVSEETDDTDNDADYTPPAPVPLNGGSPTVPTLSGNGQIWRGGSMEFTFEGNFVDFRDISVDRKVTTDFEARSGSTIITLPPSFLGKLSPGEHTLRAKFKKGFGEASFIIPEEIAVEDILPKNPANTGLNP